MSLPFLLEIGTEEIPDRMIWPAVQDLGNRFKQLLADHRIDHQGPPEVDATPRRLVVRATIAEKQQEYEHTIAGPPLKAGESAILGFAKKMGVRPEDLSIESTPKGERVTCNKKDEGELAIKILADVLPGFILETHFPKTMYWQPGGPRFVRPIRWVVALLGSDVVHFSVADLATGNITRGHRILGSSQISVTFESYEQNLRDNFVILSKQERIEKIKAEITHLGVKIRPDLVLLDIVSDLAEYPTAITGSFDPEFLKLPSEVLVTVMRHHQKYFSVESADGKLAPQFVAVMNTSGDPEGLVRQGNERVLRARFNDGRFFWETDQKKKLADRVADLANVTFQAKLGSYLAKTERVVELVQQLGGDEHAKRAAHLCKADLSTELVKEFTELQGVVGGLYAREQGEPEAVWQAIYDHYKPESMEDAIPRGRSGQLVSLADKLDTLRECFKIGMAPTGSRDPFALRRAAQGVVKIIVEGKMQISLLDLLGGDEPLRAFFEDRVRFYLREARAFRYDEVNAAMAAGWNDLVDLESRLLRVQRIRPTADFEPLAASFKRIKNILRQAEFQGGFVFDAQLLEHGPEKELHEEITRTAGQPLESVIASLRPKVDLFFEKVLVNAPDANVRQNRLTLLHNLLQQFSTIADFSEIVTSSQETK